MYLKLGFKDFCDGVDLTTPRAPYFQKSGKSCPKLEIRIPKIPILQSRGFEVLFNDAKRFRNAFWATIKWFLSKTRILVFFMSTFTIYASNLDFNRTQVAIILHSCITLSDYPCTFFYPEKFFWVVKSGEKCTHNNKSNTLIDDLSSTQVNGCWALFYRLLSITSFRDSFS